MMRRTRQLRFSVIRSLRTLVSLIYRGVSPISFKIPSRQLIEPYQVSLCESLIPRHIDVVDDCRDQAHQQSHLWRWFPSSMRALSKSPARLSDQPLNGRPFFFLKKLQNVMAVTDFLALFWQFKQNQKRVT